MPRFPQILATGLGMCLLAGAASAQQAFDSVGTRALGMGGAFVAVADDATAAYWNPAGLVTAGAANLSIEWVRFQTGDQNGAPAPGPSQRTASFLSAGAVPLALSYTNLQFTNLVTGVGSGASVTGARAAAVSLGQYGLTLDQTVTRGVVVGTTLKVLRGFATSAPVTAGTVSGALSQGASLSGDTKTAFDLDIGVMIEMDIVRIGVTVKNLRQPSFPVDAESAIQLQRQARAGVAVLPTSGLTLAMDVDLDTVDLQGGLRRMIAFGGEEKLGQRLAVRGGVRWSLVGDRNPAGSAGLSLALRRGLWIDGQYTRGGLDADRGFGVGLRAGR